MERWEYMKLTLDWAESTTWTDALNAFGAEGWELTVGVAPHVPQGYLGLTAPCVREVVASVA